jgi:hypothetical protein
MKEKYIFDDFKSYKSSHDKYYELGSYMKVNKFGDYDLFSDLLSYKADKSAKREETPQEKEARLLREKAQLREAKIDKLLSDDKKSL